MRCDTIEELNVDSKVECDQLGLAHETENKHTPVPGNRLPGNYPDTKPAIDLKILCMNLMLG